jgi:iron(III) transport system substrate-binding protein
MLGILKPAGALAPLQSAFMLPEITDESAWLQNTLWWADEAEPYTTLNFQGLLATPVFVNPTLVNPNEFTSYWDFVNPKWKGKIVSSDIRVTGPGGVPARFIYKHPELGAEWFDRLYGDQDVTISRDQRQMVDWLVQGRFPILLFVSNSEFVTAKEQGLPIAVVPIERFKEGGAIGPGGGSLAWYDRAPHPNAAKVFINWLLSREGQLAWQRQTTLPSLRIDIPKDGLIEEYVPKRGYTYVDGGSEEYGRITSDVFGTLITRALERSARR